MQRHWAALRRSGKALPCGGLGSRCFATAKHGIDTRCEGMA
nr:MAG TPA: hypothetical protein [Caudoviricetes sp.]